jgi:hypothetical protein
MLNPTCCEWSPAPLMRAGSFRCEISDQQKTVLMGHLEFRSGLFDGGGLIQHLDHAKSLLLGSQLVDGPGRRLGQLWFLGHAASIDRML